MPRSREREKTTRGRPSRACKYEEKCISYTCVYSSSILCADVMYTHLTYCRVLSAFRSGLLLVHRRIRPHYWRIRYFVQRSPSVCGDLKCWGCRKLKKGTQAFVCTEVLRGSPVVYRCCTARMLLKFRGIFGWNCPSLCSGWHAHIIRTRAQTQKHRS